MADSAGLLDCGHHTVAATFAQLDTTNLNGFRVLTIRLASGASDIVMGVLDVNGDVKEGPHMQADESWTFGPNAGTIRTTDIYIKGTAGDRMTYVGTKV